MDANLFYERNRKILGAMKNDKAECLRTWQGKPPAFFDEMQKLLDSASRGDDQANPPSGQGDPRSINPKAVKLENRRWMFGEVSFSEIQDAILLMDAARFPNLSHAVDVFRLSRPEERHDQLASLRAGLSLTEPSFEYGYRSFAED